MRKITEIIIHCSATPRGRNVTAAQIDSLHRQQGWRCIGYHYFIRLDGTIERGRPESESGAHCKGHNACSIGICYAGGLETDGRTPADTRTARQRASLLQFVAELKSRYPTATVHGHNEFARKTCPCFNVAQEFNKC